MMAVRSGNNPVYRGHHVHHAGGASAASSSIPIYNQQLQQQQNDSREYQQRQKRRGRHGRRLSFSSLFVGIRNNPNQRTGLFLMMVVLLLVFQQFFIHDEGRRRGWHKSLLPPDKPRIIVIDSESLQPPPISTMTNEDEMFKLPKYHKRTRKHDYVITYDSDYGDDGVTTNSLPYSDSYYEGKFFPKDNSVHTNCPYVAPSFQEVSSAPSTCNTVHEVSLRVYVPNKSAVNSNTNAYNYPDPVEHYRIKHLDAGGFKDVWYVVNEDPRFPPSQEASSSSSQPNINEDFVLKTTVYDNDNTLNELDKHRRDALVMEQATASQYVLNMYGYCAFSNLVQVASGGTLKHWRDEIFEETKGYYDSDDNAKEVEATKNNKDKSDTAALGRRPNKIRQYHPPSRSNSDVVHEKATEILQLAYQLAKGIADMQLFHPVKTSSSGDGHGGHGYETTLLPTVAHADLKPAQFLLVPTKTTRKSATRSANGGVDEQYTTYSFRINDFNRCRFLTYNPKTYTICPFQISTSHKGSTMRSPEEYTKRGKQDDKIDVYSFGSIIYFILTGKSPFEGIKKYKDAQSLIINGTEPYIEKEILQTTNKQIKLLIKVMRLCRQKERIDRPYSYEIVDMLEDGMEDLGFKIVK